MQVRPEVAIELPPGNADGIGDLGNAQRLGEVLPHVPKRLGRVDVRHGQHVGAMAGYDACRGDQYGLFRGRLAVHEALQQFGRGAALNEAVEIHAGKGRRREVTPEGFVAAAQDGHLLGDAQADGVTELADAYGHRVVVREDAQRQLEPGDFPGEPFGQRLDVVPPNDTARALNGDQISPGAEAAGAGDEAHRHRSRRRIGKFFAMKIGHVPEAPFGEMLGRGLTARPLVLNDAAASRLRARTELHQRHTPAKQLPEHPGLRIQVRDHAVGAERPRNLHAVIVQVNHMPAHPERVVVDAVLDRVDLITKDKQDRPAAVGNVLHGVGRMLGHESIIARAAPRGNNRPPQTIGSVRGKPRILPTPSPPGVTCLSPVSILHRKWPDR